MLSPLLRAALRLISSTVSKFFLKINFCMYEPRNELGLCGGMLVDGTECEGKCPKWGAILVTSLTIKGVWACKSVSNGRCSLDFSKALVLRRLTLPFNLSGVSRLFAADGGLPFFGVFRTLRSCMERGRFSSGIIKSSYHNPPLELL